MSEIEHSSKKERMVHDSDRDRLSELPLSIIQVILSSVSIKDAIRMSVVSRQYRYTWISLPHLWFDSSEFSSKKSMEKFVTNVLKLHKGPIHKFGISNCLIMDDWLLSLPRNEIRELILNLGRIIFHDNWPQVGSIAYECNKLNRLELCGCILGQPPLTFTGFLFLRYLILVEVFVSLNDVGKIIADSPLLETLKLDECYTCYANRELRISNPNLKYLDFETYEDHCKQIYLSTPLLVELSLSIKFDGRYEASDYVRRNRSTYNYANFFAACSSIEKLRGNFFNKVIGHGIDSCHYTFLLPHLKVIELHDVNFEDAKEASFLARLVSSSPNLQNLKLTCINGPEDESFSVSEEASDDSNMEFVCPANFNCEKLKFISVSRLAGLPSEIQFLKLMLENSSLLESMNLQTYGLTFQESQKLRAKIRKCNVASPNLMLRFC